MKSVLVIGASGKIGKMVVQKLLDRNHRVRAMVRDANKLGGMNHPHLDIFEKDLESDFFQAFQGMDSVVFTAGSGGSTGPDKTLLIDLWAARNTVEYAARANLSHVIMVSAVGAGDPDAIDSKIKPYLVAKHMADEHLINADIRHTILRPGSLTDDPATGKFTTQRPDSKDAMKITREDVADMVVLATDKEDDINRVFELFEGNQSPEDVLE